MFDYSLGVTPQPVMDELWFSLESLRSLLSFENGWQTAMADAWCSLFDAICGMTISLFSCSSTDIFTYHLIRTGCTKVLNIHAYSCGFNGRDSRKFSATIFICGNFEN